MACCVIPNSNMAVKSWLRLFTYTRVSRLNFKVERRFLNIKYCTPTAQNFRSFVNLTRKSEKYDKLWKKCVWCLAICIGCTTGFQVFDWLKNKGFQIRCYSSIAHAKTNNSKSKQFNFVADVVEIIAPAVVHIEGHSRRDGFMGHVMSSSSGSGFLVSEDGLVLTNAHVVQNVRNVTVMLADGSSIVGDIMSLDRASDLAAVQLRNPNKVRFHGNKYLGSSKFSAMTFSNYLGCPDI